MDKDHLIHIFSDVTPMKQAQLDMQQSVEDLRRSNANLEEFAYAASHDMQEPLRKIRTFLNKLRDSMGEKMTVVEKDMFRRIDNAAIRMKTLIEDLLEYAHVSRADGEVEKIDLGKKIQNILQDLELIIEEKKAVITADPLPVVEGRRRHLQQLFTNLISNAIKYSKPEGFPVVHIGYEKLRGEDLHKELKGVQPDKWYHLIKVEDNGIGFEQEHAERIFKMFQRLHGKNEYSGTGVGLAIVKKVVDSLQGNIWAESSPGEGARFYLVLPVN
jgi:light-regulated signal transduction histidine kinase (bacteriophytochrome)